MKNQEIGRHVRKTTEHAVLVILLAGVALLAAQVFWGRWTTDLTGLWLAGYFFDHGQFALIYAAPEGILTPDQMVPAWTAALESAGHPNKGALPYLYPPLWAALIAPLTRSIDIQTFMDGAFTANIVMLLLTSLFAFRLAKPSGLSVLTWFAISILIGAVSVPVLVALLQNQPQILVTFLTVLAFERLRAGASGLSGALLALAAALKLAPVIFALIFILRRDWRACVAFLVCGGILGGLSILVAGWPLHVEYLAQLSEISGRTILSNVNYSLQSVLFEATRTLPPLPILANYPTEPWIGFMAKIVFGLMLLATILWCRGGSHEALPRQLTALSIALFLCAPLSWAHYFLLPLSLLPMLAATRQGILLLLLTGIGLNFFVLSALGSLSDRFHFDVLVTIILWFILFVAMLRASIPVDLAKNPLDRRDAPLNPRAPSL